jgi:hypothetical protein
MLQGDRVLARLGDRVHVVVAGRDRPSPDRFALRLVNGSGGSLG